MDSNTPAENFALARAREDRTRSPSFYRTRGTSYLLGVSGFSACSEEFQKSLIPPKIVLRDESEALLERGRAKFHAYIERGKERDTVYSRATEEK